MTNRLKITACLMTVNLLVGCSTTQIQVNSQVTLPEQFQKTAQAQGTQNIRQWWYQWHDPVLNQLMENALKNNKNLAVMKANIDMARANSALAQSDLKPSLALTAGTTAHSLNIDNPLNTADRAVATRMGVPLNDDQQNFQGNGHRIGFIAAWEPDIFGGKRSDADAAHYAGLGAVEQWHGAQLLLTGEIADNYLHIRALQKRMHIGKQSVATLQRLQRYVKGRFQAGQATAYDVQEISAKLTAMQAQLATLQAQADAYERNLAVLQAIPAQNFHLQNSQVDVLTHIPAAPAGQKPLNILQQRPDIRAQENIVKAMSAKLASAKADLLPRFDIQFLWQTGQIRLDSDLPQLKGLGGLVNAGMTLPIFTAGRIQHHIEAADARLQAAVAQYDQTVLRALAEVDSSYQLQYSLHQQNQLLHQAVTQTQKQADNAEKLFRYGQITLDKALTARLNAENLADKQIQGQLAEAQNLLNLYKAIGGGWQD